MNKFQKWWKRVSLPAWDNRLKYFMEIAFRAGYRIGRNSK